MTKKQKRMSNIIKQFKRYVETYSAQDNADLSDAGFIKDMIYGVGIAIETPNYQGAAGFDRFMVYLREAVIPSKCPDCNGTGDARRIPHEEGVAWNRADMGCRKCHTSGLLYRIATSAPTQDGQS